MTKRYSAEVLEALREIANDHDLLWDVGRKEIEDALVDMRDSRMSLPLRNNGLVIKEKDGTDSHIIRLGPEMALGIGLKAIVDHLQNLSDEEDMMGVEV